MADRTLYLNLPQHAGRARIGAYQAQTNYVAAVVATLAYFDDPVAAFAHESAFQKLRTNCPDLIDSRLHLLRRDPLRGTENGNTDNLVVAFSPTLEMVFFGFRPQADEAAWHLSKGAQKHPDTAHAWAMPAVQLPTNLMQRALDTSRTVLCGHGLGGAMAAAAGLRLFHGRNKMRNAWDTFKETYTHASVITFGSPAALHVPKKPISAEIQAHMACFFNIFDLADPIPAMCRLSVAEMSTLIQSWREHLALVDTKNISGLLSMQPSQVREKISSFLSCLESNVSPNGFQSEHVGNVIAWAARRHQQIWAGNAGEILQCLEEKAQQLLRMPLEAVVNALQHHHCANAYLRACQDTAFCHRTPTTWTPANDLRSRLVSAIGQAETLAQHNVREKRVEVTVMTDLLARECFRTACSSRTGQQMPMVAAPFPTNDTHLVYHISDRDDSGGYILDTDLEMQVSASQLIDVFDCHHNIRIDRIRRQTHGDLQKKPMLDVLQTIMVRAVISEISSGNADSGRPLGEQAGEVALLLNSIVSRAVPALLLLNFRPEAQGVARTWRIEGVPEDRPQPSFNWDHLVENASLYCSVNDFGKQVLNEARGRGLLPHQGTNRFARYRQAVNIDSTNDQAAVDMTFYLLSQEKDCTLSDLEVSLPNFAEALMQYRNAMPGTPRIEAFRNLRNTMVLLHIIVNTQLYCPPCFLLKPEVRPPQGLYSTITAATFTHAAYTVIMTGVIGACATLFFFASPANALAYLWWFGYPAVLSKATFFVAWWAALYVNGYSESISQEYKLLYSLYMLEVICNGKSNFGDSFFTELESQALREAMQDLWVANSRTTPQLRAAFDKYWLDRERLKEIASPHVETALCNLFTLGALRHCKMMENWVAACGMIGMGRVGKSTALTSIFELDGNVFRGGSLDTQRTLDMKAAYVGDGRFVLDVPGIGDAQEMIGDDDAAYWALDMLDVMLVLIRYDDVHKLPTEELLGLVARRMASAQPCMPVLFVLNRVDEAMQTDDEDGLRRDVADKRQTIISTLKNAYAAAKKEATPSDSIDMITTSNIGDGTLRAVTMSWDSLVVVTSFAEERFMGPYQANILSTFREEGIVARRGGIRRWLLETYPAVLPTKRAGAASHADITAIDTDSDGGSVSSEMQLDPIDSSTERMRQYATITSMLRTRH